MNRYPDGTSLVGYGTSDSLSDPPCSIRTELIALSPVKLVNSLYQAEISLLDKVKEKHSSSYITLCDTYNETKVSFT